MPLTLDDLGETLNGPVPAVGTSRRAELQRALDAAVEEVTRMCGWPDATTVTVTVSASAGDAALLLPYVRLASVGAVTDAAGMAVIGTAADVRAGVVDLPGRSAGGAYTVQVTGRPWPAALAQAALEWAAHLYDPQSSIMGDPDDAPAVSTYALPNRVEELLRPYRLPGIA